MTERDVEEAYERYAHLIRRRSARILKNLRGADDVVQEVFLRLWVNAEAFRRADSKLGWLYRVADRYCFDLLSRRSTRSQLQLDDERLRLREGVEDKQVEDREVVLQLLAHLEYPLFRVAVLRYLDEMTQEEIAMATGWSRQTITKKLKQIQDRTRELRGALLGGEAP